MKMITLVLIHRGRKVGADRVPLSRHVESGRGIAQTPGSWKALLINFDRGGNATAHLEAIVD